MLLAMAKGLPVEMVMLVRVSAVVNLLVACHGLRGAGAAHCQRAEARAVGRKCRRSAAASRYVDGLRSGIIGDGQDSGSGATTAGRKSRRCCKRPRARVRTTVVGLAERPGDRNIGHLKRTRAATWSAMLRAVLEVPTNCGRRRQARGRHGRRRCRAGPGQRNGLQGARVSRIVHHRQRARDRTRLSGRRERYRHRAIAPGQAVPRDSCSSARIRRSPPRCSRHSADCPRNSRSVIVWGATRWSPTFCEMLKRPRA